MAQQLVIPDELTTNKQRDLFVKISQSVSAPCCDNGVPVAYHESGMSLHIRDLIKDAVLEGKSEKEIMAQMGELRFGENKDMEIIFTVPHDNPLGWITWISPLIVILLGIWGVFYFLKRQKGAVTERNETLSDDQVLDRYKDMIQSGLQADQPQEQST